ncbi:hypothetical protein YTPLAS18_36310 [Nitrospira sp.]|nr:hypothetical protein YTPLAS18_36310 [Nitrospira sp.]
MVVGAEQHIGERIIELIASMPGCQIDDLLGRDRTLSWNQVFAEIDHLSRTGQILVTLRGRGEYFLSLPTQDNPIEYPRCDLEQNDTPEPAPGEEESRGKVA